MKSKTKNSIRITAIILGIIMLLLQISFFFVRPIAKHFIIEKAKTGYFVYTTTWGRIGSGENTPTNNIHVYDLKNDIDYTYPVDGYDVVEDVCEYDGYDFVCLGGNCVDGNKYVYDLLLFKDGNFKVVDMPEGVDRVAEACEIKANDAEKIPQPWLLYSGTSSASVSPDGEYVACWSPQSGSTDWADLGIYHKKTRIIDRDVLTSDTLPVYNMPDSFLWLNENPME